MQYRAEIDGLRAIAVGLVIAFHIGVSGLAGGFIGVDVFFVISGYLITSIIRREVQDTGGFDFARFYVRRVRRLFPATLVTVGISFAVAVVLFPPDYLVGVADSALSAIVSASNFYFWGQSGYFDTSSTVKPLLHTWSLGVEEQFYLVWPALVFVACKFVGIRWRFVALAAIGIASFWACRYYADASGAIFFMTPFRIFEFCIGAAVIALERWTPPRIVADVVLTAGLACIVASSFLLSDHAVFPSFNALPACLGAAAVIYAAKLSRFRGLLGNAVTAFVGRISFSLYLVHWPLIVFYRYWIFRDIDGRDQAILLVLTIAFGLVLHFSVERPLRYAKFATGRVLGALAFCGLIVAAPALGVRADGGGQWRYSEATLRLMHDPLDINEPHPLWGCFKDQYKTRADIPASCYTPDPKSNLPTIILVGDSTANQLAFGMGKVMAGRAQILVWASGSCPSIYKYSIPMEGTCDQNNAEFYDHLVKEFHYDLVIFSSTSAADMLAKNFSLGSSILDSRKIPYVMVGQSLFYKDWPIHLIARFGGADLDRSMKSGLDIGCDGEDGYDKIVPSSQFFSLKSLLCDGDQPVYQVGGRILQHDRLHMTDFGSEYVSEKLSSWLDATGQFPSASQQISAN